MRTVAFHTLGCKVNQYDSQAMLELFEQAGYEPRDFSEPADVYVVNTCTVTGTGDKKSLNAVRRALRTNPSAEVVIAGCLAQRDGEKLLETGARLVIGNARRGEVVRLLEEAVASGQRVAAVTDILRTPYEPLRVSSQEGRTRAVLKIQEGCDRYCTYCIIPKLRGSYRSVPMERLVQQAQDMADRGVRELILVAQETTVYGTDLYGRKCLAELLRKLCRINGIRWIRILYCYPEEIDDDLIEVMREEKKICHYLDLPIQHASDRILKRMGRRTSRADLTEIVSRLRREIPDIILRTSLITGFPGETEEDHQILMDFVDEMEFDRLGVFTYSQEDDTPAASMPDQIPEETKLKRQEEIMLLQQEISAEKGEQKIGQEMLVMIEGKVSGENAYIGRTYGDAPKVDGYIFVQTGELLMTGDFARVTVTGALEYDLIGEITDESAE